MHILFWKILKYKIGIYWMNFVCKSLDQLKCISLPFLRRERIVDRCVIDGDGIYLYENNTTTKKKW